MKTHGLRPDVLLSDAPRYKIAADQFKSFDPGSLPVK